MASIDVACDAFELAWQRGESPQLKDYLLQVPKDLENLLLRELVLLDAEYRRRGNQELNSEQLYRDLPDYKDVISSALKEDNEDASPIVDWSSLSQQFTPEHKARFQSAQFIGRGACGSVFQVFDTELEKTVAIKVPHPHLLDNAQSRSRFNREARYASRLEHAGIVRVLEVHMGSKGAFIISDFVEGETLDVAMKRRGGPFASDIAARLILDVAEALAYAHELGIVHRDLKPSNLLLEYSDTVPPASLLDIGQAKVRITDFGLARKIGSESRLTGSNEVLGTLAYMSPEQAQGDAAIADSRSDIYSLGVLFFELLTGFHPYPLRSGEILQWLQSDCPVPDFPASVPASLREICGKCLEKQPQRRYQVAIELVNDLRHCRQGSSSKLERAALRRYRSRRFWQWFSTKQVRQIVLAMTLTLAGIATFVVFQRAAFHRAEVSQEIMGLLSAEPSHFAKQLEIVRGRFPASQPNIQTLLKDKGTSSAQRLRLMLAIFPHEAGWDRALIDDLANCDLGFLPTACHSLSTWLQSADRQRFVAEAWSHTRSREDSDAYLRLTCVMACLDSDNTNWRTVADSVVDRLVFLRSSELASMASMLSNVRDQLLVPLRTKYGALKEPTTRERALEAILRLGPDKMAELVGLMPSASPTEQSQMVRALNSDRTHSSTLVEAELQRWLSTIETAKSLDAKARSVSNLACALLVLDAPEATWKLLGADSPPGIRFQIISDAPNLGVPAKILVARLLDPECDAQVQYSILMALGGYAEEAFDAADRGLLMEWLHTNYVKHPNGAVHSGIEWLLRKVGESKWIRQSTHEMAGIQRQGSGWFATSNEHTFVLFKGPHVFQMGNSDPIRPGSAVPGIEEESLHTTRIDRDFAVCTTHVTRGQFANFLPKHSQSRNLDGFADCPVTGVTFEDAMRYCNWLSQKEGLPSNEWYYPAAHIEDLTNIKAVAEPATARMGYRLPTESEWEFVCRGGTDGRNFFGESTRLLSEFAWTDDNSLGRVHPVGLLKSNPFGLFDIQGNLCQWCQDRYQPYPQDDVHLDTGNLEATLEARVNRGSAFVDDPSAIRSSARLQSLPFGGLTIGFRVAKSIRITSTK